MSLLTPQVSIPLRSSVRAARRHRRRRRRLVVRVFPTRMSYPVIDVNERPNFRVVTGMDSSVGAGFMNECNGRETVEGANEKYPGSRVS